MDYMEAQEIKEIMALKRGECKCGEPLEHCEEYGHDYYYCPKCMNWAYRDGERIARLE